MNNSFDIKQHPSVKTQHSVEVLAHFFGVCIIFILPEVFMTWSSPNHGAAPWFIYTKSFLYIAVFYLNYYKIIDMSLNRRQWILQVVLWNILLWLITTSINYMIMRSGSATGDFRPTPDPTDDTLRFLTFITRDSVMFVLTVALSVAIKLSRSWTTLRDKHSQLVSAQQAQELQSLKSQLNPHFLFNTLNALYALIAANPDKAQEAVHRLSNLLRYVLYENSPLVSVADELKFIDNYVKLMRLRLDDSITLNVTLDPGNSADLKIAPLIFISPVENAFKHGNTGIPGAHIDIAIICHNNVIDCMIVNSFNPDAPRDSSREGIGEQNLRKRLDLIYGENAQLATYHTTNEYCFTLTIDLNSKDN